ncbi:hypothetical protein [Cyclobacterium jeungdonense]|uniref:PepSY domain-containing protein n=1 Tax=Cyclobacterium jeungdonense TaxID=708087 RepID=A0ABT8C6R3_9BACT|nr:hypothetical protein [Cyclobacterium jeungdonense]MDN3688205.1 hypothetical protein [Cyclobacterium jeungdonense]
MNRNLTIWGIWLAFAGLILIGLISMKAQLNENFRRIGDNQYVTEDVYALIQADTASISVGDLPSSVRDVIRNDSLINKLQITAVKKISKKNSDYYDVCFLDSDNFNILVMYNKDGGVINQLHAYE